MLASWHGDSEAEARAAESRGDREDRGVGRGSGGGEGRIDGGMCKAMCA